LVLTPYVLPILIFVAGFAYFNKHAKKFAEIL
ncbi:MAG: ABC transporter permease, partial [Streptococcus thermophilus]